MISTEVEMTLRRNVVVTRLVIVFYATFQAGHLRNRGGDEGAIILFCINVCFTLTTDRKIKD